jgi:hypothetical protein
MIAIMRLPDSGGTDRRRLFDEAEAGESSRGHDLSRAHSSLELDAMIALPPFYLAALEHILAPTQTKSPSQLIVPLDPR